MHKVYAELVFLDNFTVNFLVILFASLFTKSRRRWGRFAIGAAIGGIYAAMVYGMGGFAVSIIVKIAVSLAMCFAAYYAKNEKGFLKNACTFYVASFVFAGAAYAIAFCFGEPHAQGAGFTLNPAARYVLAGLGVGMVLIALAGRVKKRTFERESNCFTAVITYGGKSEFIKAFVDTGNMAREPLSGLNVVFLSEAAARSLFDAETMELLRGNAVGSTDKLRIVPCETAAGPGVFWGVEIGIANKGSLDTVKAVACIARGSLADGCGAVTGVNLAREILNGGRYGEGNFTEDNCVDACTAETGRGRGLHKRERSASAAADAAGRN